MVRQWALNMRRIADDRNKADGCGCGSNRSLWLWLCNVLGLACQNDRIVERNDGGREAWGKGTWIGNWPQWRSQK